MTTRVVRSSSCTVRIVELGLEVEHRDNATGYISNVEGVLNRFSDAIAMIQRGAIRDGKEGKSKKLNPCQELIERITRIKKGEESVELLLLDPNGHSQILHESATSTELSEEEIAALAIGPQIPIFDSSEFEELNPLFCVRGKEFIKATFPHISYRLNQKAIHLLYRYKFVSFLQPIICQIRNLWQSLLIQSRPLQRRIVNIGMQHPWNNHHRAFDVPLTVG